MGWTSTTEVLKLEGRTLKMLRRWSSLETVSKGEEGRGERLSWIL